ncbi:hypothetical protein PHMEG_00023587, partial [Phytophthora megakarya]
LRWLVTWFKEFGCSVDDVVPVKVRRKETKEGVVKLHYSNAEYTMLPAYFTWDQLYLEMHNYVEEIRLRVREPRPSTFRLYRTRLCPTIRMLLTLTHMSVLPEIEFKFFVKGHTKNTVDRGFGHVRKRISRADVWTMDQLLEVVAHASASSALVHIPKENSTFKDYRSVVDEVYKKIKNIQKYQGPTPNPEKRQTIYNKVRSFVPDEFRSDPLYDLPNDEEERKAREIQKARIEASKKMKQEQDTAVTASKAANELKSLLLLVAKQFE